MDIRHCAMADSAGRGSQQRRRPVIRLLLITAFLSIAACDGEAPPSSEVAAGDAITSVFDCSTPGGEFAFTTRTLNPGLALWLPHDFARPYLALDQTEAASGARYQNDDVVVWLHGTEAMLEVGTQRFGACQRNARASIWEHAKLGGVDFRAAGNEPGWVLQIRARTSIELDYDYGNARIETTSAEPVSDTQSMRTTYEAQSNGQFLFIEILASPCTDSMSGEQFESTVTVKFGERTLTGCGRSLH